MNKSDSGIGYRPTWAEVNLTSLANNFHKVKEFILPGVKVMVTVKADAYGHGIIPVAKKLIECGVDCFGVASIDEGIKLRQAGINIPVLVLGGVLKEDIEPLFSYNLSQTVCSLDLAAALSEKAASLGRSANIHIEVDTGMGRLGVLHSEAVELVKKIHSFKAINIEGIFSHFALADISVDFTQYQVELFNHVLDELAQSGIRVPLIHSANSMGVIGYKESHFNMVRPGLVVYGLYPREKLNIRLDPVLSLKTKVIYIKKVPKSFGISYGHSYITKKETRIAVLPVGYGDGYPRNLSNLAPVLIREKMFWVSGRVCMDQLMVDIGDADVSVGDEAVLIGSQGKYKISAEELAILSDTIPYEIVCGLGNRIPRVYVE